MLKIIRTNKELPLPQYQTEDAAGMDLYASINEQITLKPLERKLIPAGIMTEIPSGYEIQIRPRSGLALKNGITVLNSPGTIDPDYRGEIGVILINLGNKDFIINKGDRIAQAVINKVERFFITEVNDLGESERGSGGFGSTGKK